MKRYISYMCRETKKGFLEKTDKLTLQTPVQDWSLLVNYIRITLCTMFTFNL